MIVVHSLAFSRALRVVWLLEELQVPFEVVRYERTPAYKAPEGLRALHPLGKSPVVEIGGLVLSESSAILRTIHARHGAGRFAPEPGTDAAALHDEWLDYAEGSLAKPVAAAFWARKRGEALAQADREALALHLSHVNAALEGRTYLTGDALSLADIQIAYQMAMAKFGGVLQDHPAAMAYWRRLQALPAFVAAVESTGPVMPPS